MKMRRINKDVTITKTIIIEELGMQRELKRETKNKHVNMHTSYIDLLSVISLKYYFKVNQ